VLPSQVEQVLADFVQSACSAFGDHLRAVVLFGSAAEGKLRPTSDVNVVLVLSGFEQTRADQLRQPLRLAHAAIQLQAMFLLSEEIPAAARSFAPKFADILRRRVVLFGEDPFTSVSVPREAEIRQLRQQLLNLALRLRSAYVARGLREEQLAAFVASSIGAFRSLAASLLGLEKKPASSPGEAFERLGLELSIPRWREVVSTVDAIQQGQFAPRGDLDGVFFALIEFARMAITRVEAITDGTPQRVFGQDIP
jgi:hypothetical protein